jgi:lactoylglutathione lyase
MRTLHVGLRVSERERSLAFYKALGYSVVGEVGETPLGALTMLALPGDEFVTIELVAGDEAPRAGGTLSHLVVGVDSLDDTVATVTAAGLTVTDVTPATEALRTAWLEDPDGNRIELVQWPAGHPEGMTAADFR